MNEITEEQLSWINSLACSRLRTDANCPDVVLHFTNHKTNLAELVFWFKVLPVVADVMQHVGVEYMYLFAADDTEDNVLVNYYQTKLKFEGDSNYGTNKPLYDNACKFMCLHLTDALDYLDSLKRHFNPDSTADLA